MTKLTPLTIRNLYPLEINAEAGRKAVRRMFVDVNMPAFTGNPEVIESRTRELATGMGIDADAASILVNELLSSSEFEVATLTLKGAEIWQRLDEVGMLTDSYFAVLPRKLGRDQKSYPVVTTTRESGNAIGDKIVHAYKAAIATSEEVTPNN